MSCHKAGSNYGMGNLAIVALMIGIAVLFTTAMVAGAHNSIGGTAIGLGRVIT